MTIFNEISNCNNQQNLQEDLQKLIIEHNISHITSNELLKILRKHGYTELPNEMDVKYSSKYLCIYTCYYYYYIYHYYMYKMK